MSGTLEHLVVVEVASPLTEWCGRLFSQAGARVVLVEPPGGAATRAMAPFYAGATDPERSLHFWHYNTDKESVVLDLGAAADRETFLGLVAKADILIDAPGPVAAAKQEVSGVNPRLVHVRVTPFGEGGPWEGLQATDLIHLALGGQMMMNGYDDMPASPPLAPMGNQSYHMAGSWAFVTALAMCQAAERGGFADVSVHAACAGMTEGALPNFDYTGQVVSRRTGRHASIAPTPPWQHRAADGRYMNAQMVNVPPQAWERFVQWMDSEGKAQDLTDPMYFVPEIFQERAAHISAVMGDFIASKTADEVFYRGQEIGLILSDINYPEDLVTDEHLAARQFWVDLEHEELGPLTFASSAFLAERTEIRPHRRAPHLNEHGAPIREWLAGRT